LAASFIWSRSETPWLLLARSHPAEWAAEENVMQALTLMIVYILTTALTQFIGFLISRVVDYAYPTVGLMTFLILFFVAFGVAWPIAVRITEFLIRLRGYTVETAQSGGDRRTDHRPVARRAA